MSAVDFLAQVRHKPTGAGRWSFSCPGPLHKHGDRSMSASLRELDDGRVLVHCHAGCSVEEILSAVGLTFDTLFPPRDTQPGKSTSRPWRIRDVVNALEHELLMLAVFCSDMAASRDITSEDRGRANKAAQRILHIVREVRHAG
jgi:hypothetical protein